MSGMVLTAREHRCTRGELDGLADAFDRASKVTAAEGEDKGTVARFKYACGRNLNKVSARMKQTQEMRRAIVMVDDPRMDAYQEKRTEILESYAEKDEDGKPKIDASNPEAPKYVIPPAMQESLHSSMVVLGEEYKDAWEAHEERAKAADAVLDESVSVMLHVFPFDDVPAKITGGYLVALEPMLIGAPQTEDGGQGTEVPEQEFGEPTAAVFGDGLQK